MGSILGMPQNEKKEAAQKGTNGEGDRGSADTPDAEKVKEFPEIRDEPAEQREVRAEAVADKVQSVPEVSPSPEEGSVSGREYIPIEPIRLHRREEKDMKVPVSFSLSRIMAEQLKQIAYVDRVSASEIVASLIESFISAHREELDEYRRLNERRKY